MKEYCPNCENYNLVHNGDSLMFAENYYCIKCDKIFVKELKELSKGWFKKNFESDRFDDIRQMSLVERNNYKNCDC